MYTKWIATFVLTLMWSSLLVGAQIDEDLVNRWNPLLDYDGCASDLYKADRNNDGLVHFEEYLNFVQEYGKRLCFSTEALTLQQKSVFLHLACRCTVEEGASPDCCLNEKAAVPTNGANVPRSNRTSTQNDYLTLVCKLTDATIDSKCPPTVDERPPPPGASATIVAGAAPAAEGGGIPAWLKWLLIAAAILIFLLCCCCVFRRRRAKEDEVEQEDEENVATKVQDEAQPKDVQIDPEQPLYGASPRGAPVSDGKDEDVVEFTDSPSSDVEDVQPAYVPPITASSVAVGGVVGDDDEDDEETRQKRGGGRIPDDNEPDRVIYRGAPPFPPPEPQPQPPRALRPIPPKENETDVWDQPGRDIQYPVERDDMSDGEVERYVPDGGVNIPERPTKPPLDWNRNWNRSKPEEPDEMDARKHRIQTGLGEGEVWNKLDEPSVHNQQQQTHGGDAFDWVVQSALGALGNNTNHASGQPATTNHKTSTSTKKNHKKSNMLETANRTMDQNDSDEEPDVLDFA